MNQLSISGVADLLDVSIQTLRRWDVEGGTLQSSRSNVSKHRYYSEDDIEDFLSSNYKYLLRVAKRWAYNKNVFELPPRIYCQDRSIFKGRLSKLEALLMRDDNTKDNYSLVTSVSGEIGNNSYDHNIGNWPDVPGILFGYSVKERKVILVDRGQGILKTLSRTKSDLRNDKEALVVAFTEYISGRSIEKRGNGLKYVKSVIEANNMSLHFQSGNATLDLTKETNSLNVNNIHWTIRGCFAVLTY